MNVQPITRESEICQVLPCLPEKFIVDFANGIDVARDHLRVQKERGSFFSRCCDGMTGKGARRQAEINASLIDGVEGSLEWLTDLTESLAQSNLAIARVNGRLNALKLDVARLADYSVQTRQGLEHLAQKLSERCSGIEAEVARIDFIQRVQQNLNNVFAKWEAGRFGTFSPAGCCFAAFEELRWGAFGDYCRIHSGQEGQEFLEQAINRATAQLRQHLHVEIRDRIDARIWLKPPSGRVALPDASAALAYLGDGYLPERAPFAFAVSQMVDDLPNAVPRLMSAPRLSEALAEDIFEE